VEYEGYSQCARRKFNLMPTGALEPQNATISITTRRKAFSGMHSSLGPIRLLNYFKTEAWFASLKTNVSGKRLNTEGVYFSCLSQSSSVVCEMAIHLFPFVPATATASVVRDDDIADLTNITDVVIIPLDPTLEGNENAEVSDNLRQHFSLHKRGTPNALIHAVNPLPYLQTGTYVETEPLPNWKFPCRNATFWLRMEPILVEASVLGILYELTKPDDDAAFGSDLQVAVRSVQRFRPASEVTKSTVNGNRTILQRYRLVDGKVDLQTGELGVAAITLAVLCLQAFTVIVLLVWRRRTFISDLRGNWVHPLTQRQFFGVPKKVQPQIVGSETGSVNSHNPLKPPRHGNRS
jgi:hypothetical protein